MGWIRDGLAGIVMINYVEFAAEARELIRDAGTAVTLTRESNTTTTPSYAVAGSLDDEDLLKLEGQKIEHVRKLILAADVMTFAPLPGDLIPWENTNFRVLPKGVKHTNPNGQTPIIYEVLVSR